MPSEIQITGMEDNWFQQKVVARGHELFADEPIEYGGTDHGPTPYELLLSALGSCIAITVRMYAKKKEWPLFDVKINLTHQKIHAKDCQDCEAKNGYVDVVEKQIEFVGDLSPEQTERLTAIASRCPVHRSLQASVKIR